MANYLFDILQLSHEESGFSFSCKIGAAVVNDDEFSLLQSFQSGDISISRNDGSISTTENGERILDIIGGCITPLFGPRDYPETSREWITSAFINIRDLLGSHGSTPINYSVAIHDLISSSTYLQNGTATAFGNTFTVEFSSDYGSVGLNMGVGLSLSYVSDTQYIGGCSLRTFIIYNNNLYLYRLSIGDQWFLRSLGLIGTASGGTPYDPLNTDPYQDGGESGTGGGDGTFDGTNDPVNIPSLPTVGAQDAGFISLFAPTIAQLKNLASFMWSDLFDIDTFKKIFNNPMDSILGLSVVPVAVPTSGAREITVGNIVTTVSMNVASQQYIEVDCGSVDFTSKYFGSYLDYEPYTKISIYVPYSGYHDLRTDDIMGRVVRMVYHIDILTGSLVAFLKCGDSVLYEFNGACASNIPVTNISYNSTIENAMRIAVNIGTTVATAGASAPLSASGAINMAGSTAEGALSMKPSVGRSGSMGGTTGIMGNQIPYFIVTRPRACIPNRQNHYQGYPSFITYNIGALAGKGYTAFENILLKDLYLTDGEKSELESILKEGIYL